MVVSNPDLRHLSCRTYDFDEVVAAWFQGGSLTRDVEVVTYPSRSAPKPFIFEEAAFGGISTGRHRPNVDLTVHDAPLDYVVAVTSRGQASYQQADGTGHAGAAD